MEYSVRTWVAQHGDIIPLIYVAEAMAKHAASGYGALPLHGQSLQTLRPQLYATLLHAAVKGQLTVCDQHGRIAPANELIEAAGGRAEAKPIDLLIHLYAKHHHLRRWGESNGDVFHFVDTPGTVVEWDLKNEAGEVLEAGYFRGSVWPLPGEAETDKATGDVAEPALPAWKMKIQVEAAALMTRLRNSGANPTTHSILDSMVVWCRSNNVKTDGDIYPSAGYLRTHVLGGKNWTPPK